VKTRSIYTRVGEHGKKIHEKEKVNLYKKKKETPAFVKKPLLKKRIGNVSERMGEKGQEEEVAVTEGGQVPID